MSQSALSTLKMFFTGFGRIFSIVAKIVRGLFSLLIIGGLVAWIAIIVSSTQGTHAPIPANGALRMDLSGVLVDELTYTDPIALLLTDEGPSEHSVRDLIQSLEFATTDDRINSLVLVLHGFGGGGSSKITELGSAIEDFRAAGKQVYAVADFYTQSAYLLASYADNIYINPMGGVDLRGLASYRGYYGDMLDRLKVNFHVFRTSEFKDALEPFISNEMSEASRVQTQLWMQDIWQVWRDTLLSNRAMSPDNFDRYTNEFDQLMLEYEGNAANITLALDLVDMAAPRDEILQDLVARIGTSEAADSSFYSYVDYLDYLGQIEPASVPEGAARIGLVAATGNILDGRQEAGAIGGDSLSLRLRQIREDNNIDALVIRVDSPGGSAFASELIRRELQLIREQGVPLVISMSSVAASGGYWISAPADEIWALPATLTGSIGAFIAVPTFEDSLRSVGITNDGTATGPLAGGLQLDRPLSEPMKIILQSSLENLYGEFLALVADSRGIEPEVLINYADGRVWSGQQALERGLVDKLGGLKEAIASAALLADSAENYEVIELAPAPSWKEEVMRLLGGSVSGWLPKVDSTRFAYIQSLIAAADGWLAQLPLQLNDPAYRYIYCSDCNASL